MTEIDPSVSVLWAFLTIAFLSASRCTAKAKATVTVATNPSGITLTAREIPNFMLAVAERPLAIAIIVMMTQRPTEIITKYIPSIVSFLCIGVLIGLAPVIRADILPICSGNLC